MAEHRFNITATMCHAKDQHIAILNTIDYDVLANWETPRTNAKILATRTSQIWVPGKKKKPICDRINQAVGNFEAATLFGDVVPNIVQIG
ncbi:MAG TPA: hypothetical protein VNW97_08355 [Candidatus Saccharimonadales bacterium]|nr:hypothetical protein [Candidatus Saccharimonadales bacterium]